MNNKKDCKIIQDLLPNYIDNLTTQETNNFIEEHLKECEECKKKYENMKNDLKVEENKNQKKSINFIKKYNKKMKFLKIIILAIIVLYLALIAKKAIIMGDLVNKASKKARTEYEVSYKITQEYGTIYANSYVKGDEYIVEYDYVTKEGIKTHIIEICNGNTSNYYIENANGEKTAILNQTKGNVMKLTVNECCFAIDNNLYGFIDNLLKSSIRLLKNDGFKQYYYISNYEWAGLGTSELYINKETGIIERAIILQSNISTPIEENSIIDIDFSSGYGLNENIVKEREPNIEEYKIIEQ